MNKINELVIPDFSCNEFKLTPKNPFCEVIDSTRLMVEVLGGLKSASSEFNESSFSSKLLIDGRYALVMRYKREKDGRYYPTCTLSFDEDENGNIVINQLQGSRCKHVAFRFHSSFNSILFYLKLIEENFSKKGIYVYVKDAPEGLKHAPHLSNAYTSYNILRTGIEGLNRKYGLKRNS